MKNVLVTGAAGFIGFHLCNRLLTAGFNVTGADNLNDYYEPTLKLRRLEVLGVKSQIPYNSFVEGRQNFRFIKLNLEDKEGISKLFADGHFSYVVNLGAQAGVRYSLENPYSYIDSNIMGFLNILEGCRNNPVEHLVFASSSSVYGLNEKTPFSVHDHTDHPISLYAASKKANEMMAHSYSHLYRIPCSGLRFFTVYGPWGRPDMALFIFTKKILAGESIDVYNHGNMQRDFTYVDDIVESIYRLLPLAAQPNPSFSAEHVDPASSTAPYRIYNIGNNSPVQLMDFIRAIEEITGKEAKINFMPIQPGDVNATYADVNSLINMIHFQPRTSVLDGIRQFITWYKDYYNV